jgi:hypothetical protein
LTERGLRVAAYQMILPRLQGPWERLANNDGLHKLQARFRGTRSGHGTEKRAADKRREISSP